MARRRKRKSPDQTRSTIEAGGTVSEYPRMIPRVTGRVAEWIRIIPIHPANSLNFFITFIIFPFHYRYIIERIQVKVKRFLKVLQKYNS